MSRLISWRRIAAAALVVALSAAVAVSALAASGAPVRAAKSRKQTTQLISRSYSGGTPNGASSNAVISGDRRWARIIAYQSDATNIVRGDTNGTTDVFAVKRAGHVRNNGAAWRRGKTILVSRARGGHSANGPSFSPAVDGGFHSVPSCVAFLSAATNFRGNDTNGVVDAFVSKRIGNVPHKVSLLPGGHQVTQPVTRVAVSGDCSRIAFVTGGRLYVRIKGQRTKALSVPGPEDDPSFSTGKRNDLVFSGARGVYLSRSGTGHPKLVARGGFNPAYNDIKRQVVTYEIRHGGYTQIGYKDLGHKQHIISATRSHAGDGDSRDPVIGNSGYYVAFETDAHNLSKDAARREGDHNGQADVYLYTNVRHLTLVESVLHKGTPLPGGGRHPSMSFYANYILFDSPGSLRSGGGPPQVFMRWLGAV